MVGPGPGQWLGLALTTLMVGASCAFTTSNDLKSVDCKLDLDTAKNITLNELMGKWYTKELTRHSSKGGIDRKVPMDSCILIDLQPKPHSEQFFLVWTYEGEASITYTFQLSDDKDPASWVSVGNQYVPEKLSNYFHFGGNVHVMKSGSLLILNFCAMRQMHYSVTMSRDRDVSNNVLASARDLMERQGLPRINVQRYCPEITLQSTLSSSLFWPIVIAVVIAIAVIFSLFYYFL